MILLQKNQTWFDRRSLIAAVLGIILLVAAVFASIYTLSTIQETAYEKGLQDGTNLVLKGSPHTSNSGVTITQISTGKTWSSEDPEKEIAQIAPANETVLYKADDLSEYTSDIIVQTPHDLDCTVKLKNPKTKKTIYAFFVQRGRTAEKPIPAGTYDVCFAFGEIWYGYYHLFGAETSCQIDKKITFREQELWEYTLYPVASGNLTLGEMRLSEMLAD